MMPRRYLQSILAVPGLILLLALFSVGCGGKESSGKGEIEALHWPPIEGAERYTVRLWSSYRLLMEASTQDTILAIDPNLRRAMAEFDTLSLELLGYEGWEGDEKERGRMRVQLRP